MNLLYPTSLITLNSWIRETNIPVGEARIRLAQYAVLRSFARDRQLRHSLVFKGGNALDFVWQPNRSTRDLDFTIDQAGEFSSTDSESLQDRIRAAVARDEPAIGVTLALQRFRASPPGPNRTFVTYQASVAYALDDDRRNLLSISEGRTGPSIVPVEISTNEILCADVLVNIGDRYRLRVSTVEDIIAEKLRALLQQVVRNRNRCQDLLDIAVLASRQPNLHAPSIADYLRRKADARGIAISKSAFRNPGVIAHAASGYDALSQTTRSVFIPFDDAVAALHAFVDTLPIPE